MESGGWRRERAEGVRAGGREKGGWRERGDWRESETAVPAPVAVRGISGSHNLYIRSLFCIFIRSLLTLLRTSGVSAAAANIDRSAQRVCAHHLHRRPPGWLSQGVPV